MVSTRKVTAVVSFTGQDYENFGSNEYAPPLNTSKTVVLSDHLPQNIVNFVSRWGGECRAEFNMVAQRMDNGEVRMVGDFLLYEGTSENTDDLDGVRHFEFIVPRSGSVPFTCHVRNDDEGDDDWGHVEVMVQNDRVVDQDND